MDSSPVFLASFLLSYRFLLNLGICTSVRIGREITLVRDRICTWQQIALVRYRICPSFRIGIIAREIALVRDRISPWQQR